MEAANISIINFYVTFQIDQLVTSTISSTVHFVVFFYFKMPCLEKSPKSDFYRTDLYILCSRLGRSTVFCRTPPCHSPSRRTRTDISGIFYKQSSRREPNIDSTRTGTGLLVVYFYFLCLWGGWFMSNLSTDLNFAYITYPQCCRSMTFWCGSGSADPCHWLINPDSDTDPAIFVIRHFHR